MLLNMIIVSCKKGIDNIRYDLSSLRFSYSIRKLIWIGMYNLIFSLKTRCLLISESSYVHVFFDKQ